MTSGMKAALMGLTAAVGALAPAQASGASDQRTDQDGTPPLTEHQQDRQDDCGRSCGEPDQTEGVQ